MPLRLPTRTRDPRPPKIARPRRRRAPIRPACWGVLVVGTWCLASPALAWDCRFVDSNTGTAVVALPANLVVPRDTPVGSVLFDSGWVTAGPATVECKHRAEYHYGYAGPMGAVAPGSKVYMSGVPGIGIEVGWANYMSTPSASLDQTALAWPQVEGDLGKTTYGPMGQYRVVLSVTGAVTPGRFTIPATLANNRYDDLTVNQLLLSNNNAAVSAPACTVQTPVIAVTMPTGKAADMKEVGATTGDTSFQIALNCSGATALKVTMTDATHPENTGNVLSLTGDSKAGGVGYRIAYQSVPVSFGADSPTAGNPNQIAVGMANGAGTVSIPFVASYVRTGTVAPGEANAAATFTMSYQ